MLTGIQTETAAQLSAAFNVLQAVFKWTFGHFFLNSYLMYLLLLLLIIYSLQKNTVNVLIVKSFTCKPSYP